MSQTIITFAGLIVFRHDPGNDIYELGILRARNLSGGMPDHFLQIVITPDPRTGQGTWELDPVELDRYLDQGNVFWNLDVELNSAIQKGIQANASIPNDRNNPNAQNMEDFGWIINLESGEFHGEKLTRLAGKLLPVIYLSKGKLYTSCKTEAVELKRGSATIHPNFGFIAGAIALNIDTSAGEESVLNFMDKGTGKKKEIFRLNKGRSYEVALVNTPLTGTAPQIGGHFRLFYDLLFSQVGGRQRFSIKRTSGPKPPDPCPKSKLLTPDPFKCGGVGVNDASGPLG